MQQILYLQPDDDLAAVGDLLEGAQAKRLLLVLPGGNAALRDPLAMRLLRRTAYRLAVDVALVTRDTRTREAARAEGVATVPSLLIGRWDRWQSRSPGWSAAERAAVARVASMRLGRKDPGYRDRALVWTGRVLGALLLVTLLGVVLAVAAFTIPEARITLVPYRQSVDVSLTLRADPDVEKASLEDLVIPARLVEGEVEESATTPTMTTMDAPDAPATGILTLINQTAVAREILPGAVVRTSTGTTVRFQTVTTVTLEARIGASAEAEIEALEPGPVGNVAAATINAVETSALRDKVRVINAQPTSGGGVKQVGVVTRADMDRLKALLLQQLQQRAYVDLKDKLTETEFLPAESMTVEIVSEVYDQFLEAEADSLKLTMRIYTAGTAVDRTSAKLLGFQALKAKVPDTYALNSDEIDFELSEQVSMDGRKVMVQCKASAGLVADVDRSEVRSLAAGKTADEAEQTLFDTLALGARPVVEVQPEWIKRFSWLDRVPRLPLRIQVVVVPSP